MNKCWLLLFLPYSIACASVNEPMRWEIESGYRNDALHWHDKKGEDLVDSERCRDLQFWENALLFKVIYRDIAVFAKGAYGALGSGSMKQAYSNLSFTQESPSFTFHGTGWTLDGWGYFGYSVNLTAERTYNVILIPMIGYGVDYEKLERHGTQKATGAALSAAETYSMLSSPSNLHMCWFGPLFGGVFKIQPGGRLQFEAGYAYHRLHVRFFSKMSNDVSIFSSGVLLSETDQTDKLKVKDGANLAHSGWARIDYTLSKEWRAGLFAQIQYFASRILDGALKNETTGIKETRKFKARWTAISGALTLSRTF